MSDIESKTIHSARRANTIKKARRQANLAKAHGTPVEQGQYHRYAKRSWCTCGNSNCVMCSSPRKTFGILSLQEQSFNQINKDTELCVQPGLDIIK